MGETRGDVTLRNAVRSAVQRVLAGSDHYGGQVRELRRLRTLAHEELAAAFESRFNAALQEMPQQDVDAKRLLCASANETLKSLGLSIRDPKTGLSAILVADTRSADDDRGRFRLEVRHPDGRVVRTLSSTELVEFELCEAPVRHEPLARRFRAGGGPSEATR
jgi:hypothetical protein